LELQKRIGNLSTHLKRSIMGNSHHFQSILVVGIGLIGGSILKGLVKNNFPGDLYGLDKDYSVIKKAFDKKMIINSDENLKIENENCLVIFCVPTLSFIEALEKVKSYHLPIDTIFTDTFSSKTNLIEYLNAHPNLKSSFVLGHPIAGSEKSGIKNSINNLFKEKLVLVSPFPENDTKQVSLVESFWSTLGSKVTKLEPEKHDIVFARTSHLPHIISYSLMHSLIDKFGDQAFNFSGGSLEDYTRTSSSDPTMWKDISISNKEEILLAINDFTSSLNSLKALISEAKESEIEEFLTRIKGIRDSLIEEKL